MKVAIVAPQPSPTVRGGTERAVEGICRTLNAEPDTSASIVKLTVDESNLPGLVDAYERFSHLDLSGYDRVISVKYPAWMVAHPHHSVYMFHPLRGVYDTYHLFGLPERPNPETPQATRLLDFIARNQSRDSLFEFFGRFSDLVHSVPPDAPDLAFPGPIARALVHWLDRIALDPARVEAYFALSRTVAGRPEYFPDGVVPVVVPLPGDHVAARPAEEPGSYLFTASRLDGPKRLDLLIDAMALCGADVPLRIAGTGPSEADLRARARNDPRIEFLGFVPDDRLTELYRGAIAVPFVPYDEDLGLISIEAGGQGTPIVTCRDSGGPTEFVAHGVNGLISSPTPAALGTALGRIVADPAWARRMGRAAYRKASGVTWQETATTLIDRGPTHPPRPDLAGPGGETNRGHAGHRPRIVSLATYGIVDPAHGGQLRVHNLCRSLATTMDVHQLALDVNARETTTTTVEAGLECTIVPRSAQQIQIEDALGITAGQPVTDIMSGIDAQETPEFLDRLRALTSDADLVVLEQPFLFPALAKAGVTTPFVVNTQNVERDLREGTLAESPLRTPLLDAVGQIEAHALTEAVAVTACSTEDAQRFSDLYGLDAESITLVPNGTNVPSRIPDRKARQRSTELWLRRFGWNQSTCSASHLGVFFGSWHPPNIDAAEFLIDLAAAVPDFLIVSAGNHGLAFTRHELPDNIIFPGPIAAREKDALLASASVALNPMRTGSGTNLKIIEFLAHGVPTVSTPFGARGLSLADGRQLLLAPVEDFAAALRCIVNDPDAAAQRVRDARAAIVAYDWEVIGARYRDLLTGLVKH